MTDRSHGIFNSFRAGERIPRQGETAPWREFMVIAMASTQRRDHLGMLNAKLCPVGRNLFVHRERRPIVDVPLRSAGGRQGRVLLAPPRVWSVWLDRESCNQTSPWACRVALVPLVEHVYIIAFVDHPMRRCRNGFERLIAVGDDKRVRRLGVLEEVEPATLLPSAAGQRPNRSRCTVSCIRGQGCCGRSGNRRAGCHVH